jgi:hypothetical protein
MEPRETACCMFSYPRRQHLGKRRDLNCTRSAQRGRPSSTGWAKMHRGPHVSSKLYSRASRSAHNCTAHVFHRDCAECKSDTGALSKAKDMTQGLLLASLYPVNFSNKKSKKSKRFFLRVASSFLLPAHNDSTFLFNGFW